MPRIGYLPSARRNPHNVRMRHVERKWYPKKGYVRPDTGKPVPAMRQYPLAPDKRSDAAILAARTMAYHAHKEEVAWIERDIVSWANTLYPNTLPRCTFGPHGSACETHAYARKTLQAARRTAKPAIERARKARNPAKQRDALSEALAKVRAM